MGHFSHLGRIQVEDLLEGFVADWGLSPDQFVDACARGMTSKDLGEVSRYTYEASTNLHLPIS